MKNIHIPKSIKLNNDFHDKSQKISEQTSKIVNQGISNEIIIDNKIHPLSFSKLNFTRAEKEYLSISTDIHLILSSYPDLPNDQKLDYCNSQRYFMKLYLKEVLIKINRK